MAQQITLFDLHADQTLAKKVDKFTVEREKILEEVFEILDIKKWKDISK